MSSEPTSAPSSQPPAVYDEPYTFGRPPATYLAVREIVRLTILRSRLGDRLSAAGEQRD